MPRFREIPQFTKEGSYHVTVPWRYLEKQLETWNNLDMGEFVDMDPDFQRGHVWTPEQQTRYCEYILRGGISSKVIYWNSATWGTTYSTPIQLVDGKQRVTAVLAFLHNEIKVFGCFYKEYSDRLDSTYHTFNFVVNDLKTRAEVLQWYLDLNIGGTIHTSDEIEKVKRLLKQEIT